jgi:hypothetical protein
MSVTRNLHFHGKYVKGGSEKDRGGWFCSTVRDEGKISVGVFFSGKVNARARKIFPRE